MALKDILDRIQRGLSADADQSLRDMLADAIAEAAVMADSLGAKNRENERNRLKNTELTATLEAKEAEIATLKASQNSDELKALQAKAEQYDALLTEQAKTTIKEWNEAYKKLTDIPDTDPRHAKIEAFKGTITTPDEGKGIDAATAKQNMTLFKAFEAGGGLMEPEKATGKNPPGTGKAGEQVEDYVLSHSLKK